MRLGGVAQGVALIDLDAHLAGRDPFEQFGTERRQVGPLGGVGHQGRPGDEQRALLREQDQVDRRHRPGGVAIGNHHAHRAQAVQRTCEGVLADTVVHHRHAFAAGDVAHALGEVLGGVIDHVVAAVRPGQFRLGRRADGADHRCTERLGPLAGDQADPAGRRVDQHGIAGLHAVGLAQQVGSGQALQHHRRAGVETDAVGQDQQAMRRDVAHLGIGANRPAGIGHAVADLDLGDALTDRLDHPGAFQADARGQGQRIEAGTVIGIDVVEADGVVAHRRFAGGRGGQVDCFPAQNLGAAGLVNTDGVGHRSLLAFLLSRLRGYHPAPLPSTLRRAFRQAPQTPESRAQAMPSHSCRA